MTGAATAPLSPAAQSARIAKAVRGSFRAFFEIEHLGGDYVYGRHTAAIIEACEAVVRDVEAGRSRYLIINLPFRHGKSDISSRALPAWWLLRNPEAEVMLGAYGSTLAEGFARDARTAFERWAPHYGLGIDRGSRAVDNWRIAGRRGGMRSVGLQGGAVGHGFKLGVIDDFYKSRLEAESPVIRNRVWEGFQADFLTRRAPVSGLIIVAHRQHTHDLCARIIGASTPGHEDYNAAFPKFDVLRFPAQSSEYAGPDNPEGWLFPERWSADYYESQRAMMSPYLWSALAMQSPTVRAGNVFTLSNVAEWDDASPPPDGLRWSWGWDLASTEEQRLGLKSGDPDYTCGVLAAWEPGRAPSDAGTIWIKRVVRGRWAAAERERVMIREIERTPEAGVYVEVVAGYRDAYTRLRELLPHRGVMPITPTRDKLTRAERCEAVFAHGRVRIAPEAAWADQFLDEVGAFPSAPHDDQVDAMVLALDDALTKRAGELAFGPGADGPTPSGEPDPISMAIEPVLLPVTMPFEPGESARAGDMRRIQWRAGLKGYEDWPNLWRDVRLWRSWWLARANPAACLWGSVDAEGAVTVFQAIEAERGESIPDFVGRVHRGSFTGATPHSYGAGDFAGGEDDEEGLFRVHDVLSDLRARSYPEWVTVAELRGRRGMEVIDGWIAAAERGNGACLMVWPPGVLRQIRDARLKPMGVSAAGLTGGDAPEDVIAGSFVKALRVAGLRMY